MNDEAERHIVGLKINRKTFAIEKSTPPQGCKFHSEGACNLFPSISFTSESGKTEFLRTKQPNSFIYLDVGVWAGNVNNFGLICGRNVLLCSFTHNMINQSKPINLWDNHTSTNPLEVFDREMSLTNKHGFRVETFAYVSPHSKYCPPEDILYLIMPDMHITSYPYYEEFKLKSNAYMNSLAGDSGASALNQDYRMRLSPERREEINRFRDYDQTKKADIFGNADVALYDFLDFVTTLLLKELDGKIKVIQMGDMYELWQGMGRLSSFFTEDPNSHGLIFKDDALPHLVRRIEGIDNQYSKVMLQFDHLEKLNAIRYLYGNHDVYLVDIMRRKDKKWNDYLNKKRTLKIGQLAFEKQMLPRKTNIFENYLAFEHGHRTDTFNEDGSNWGPFITEMVYWLPFLRALDPDQHPKYHAMSAIDVYYHNYWWEQPISVFVMAHSHAAELKYILLGGVLPEDDRRDTLCATCYRKNHPNNRNRMYGSVLGNY
jgi:hypothetical protein